MFAVNCSFAQSGAVFRDYNQNGTKDTNEPLVAGVVVNAYNTAGALCATTTSTAATTATNYTLPTTCSGTVRVEFIIPSTGTTFYAANSTFDYTGYGGSSYGSSVQFVTAGASNVNFAISYPNDYCQTNPKLVTPCYVNGTTGTDTPTPTMVAFDYANTGTTGTETGISNKSQVGSTWGVAYSKTRKLVYTSAFAKRHVGLGSGGLGAIYSIDPNAAANGTVLISSISAGTIATNSARGLGLSTATSADVAGFSAVGTVGLGDLDISEDESKLYVVNLFDKKVYIVDIASKTVLSSVSIPDPQCGTSGTYRPFALKIYRGKLYAGVICDASSSATLNATTANLKAFVYEMDLSTNTFNSTAVLNFPLNYLRSSGWNEPTYGGTGATGLPAKSRLWYPWKSTFTLANFNGYTATNTQNNPEYEICHPTPILSDIEFDSNGAMILGFSDRTSHQMSSTGAFAPDNATSGYYEKAISGGDILKATPSGSAWAIETLTYSSPTGATTPAEAEFFTGDKLSTFHLETAQGGLLLLPGTGEVVTTTMDPIDFNSGGVNKLSLSAGTQNSAFQIFSGGFNKATGLGDLEATCNLPSLEIGNRVWNDLNSNGIQDAGETGISGVVIALFDGTTSLGTTTTNANGNWYFNDSNLADGSAAAGTQLGVQPNKAYTIKIGSASWSSSTGNGLASLLGKSLTTANATPTAGIQDMIDSDAALVSSVPTITYTTTSYGQNNHTLDFGFSAGCTSPTALTAGSNTPVAAGSAINLTSSSTGGTSYSWSGPNGFTSTTQNPSISSATSLMAGTYTVTVLSSGTCTATATTAVVVNTPTTCTPPTGVSAGSNSPVVTGGTINLTSSSTGGTSYSWSGPNGFTSTTQNPSISSATSLMAGTYTVTVLSSGTCTATGNVLVNITPTPCPRPNCGTVTVQKL